MSFTLDGIDLPEDLLWSDEFTSWKVGQVIKTSLTGARIIQQGALQAGRPITLESVQDGNDWVAVVDLQTLNQLIAHEQDAEAGPFSLVMPDHNSGDRTLSVMWRREGGSAIAARAIKQIVPAVNTDFYSITLRLIQVA